MANPLRAAEWLVEPGNTKHAWRTEHDEVVTDADGLEAYAAYLLSELEREQRESAIKAKLLGKKGTHAWAVKFADDVAAFRKRVMEERKCPK